MNNKASVLNTFSGGMASDYDPQRQQNNTYLYSLSGRIIFNKDGTISWENDRGTEKVLTIGFDYGNPNFVVPYKIIGGVEVANKLIVFSTQNDSQSALGYSEIGIITEPQSGVFQYQTIFNDKYDPYGGKLYFNSRYQIKADAVLENESVLRVYWNDDFNEPRVFNVLSGLSFGYSVPYPQWYSAHSMDRMMDVQFGLIKYRRNVAGNLTAGKRAYSYRLYHESGYATPWTPLTDPIMMTASQVNKDNWTQYVMTESGAQSNKGHELEVKYIDQRFQKIEVACALYETDAAPIRADIIFKGEITGDSMIVTHSNNNGIEPIPAPETLVQRYTDITKAKTQVSNENFLHNMNLVLRRSLEINTDSITVDAIVKRMLSDELGGIKYTPLTHQEPKTTTITKPMFSGFSEQYMVDNDYINYKGTQWEHLFKSRWRDSVYPLAIVLFSKKGQPFFAQYIGDFKTPAQNNNTWELKRLSGVTTGTSGPASDYYRLTAEIDPSYMITDTINQQHIAINIMGLNISGIDLTDVLYDDFGNFQISGFSIVQADRVPDIICQGLLMNANLQKDYSPYEGSKLWVYPLTTCGIGAYQVNAGTATPPLGLVANTVSAPSNNNVGGFIIDLGSPGSVYVKSVINSGLYTFESPEYLFDTKLVDNESARKFSIEGNCQAAFLDLPTFLGVNVPNSLQSETGHFYTKQYHTFPNVRFYDAIDGIDNGDSVFTQYGITRDAKEVVASVFDQDNLSLGDGKYAIRNKKVRTAAYTAPKLNSNENFFSQGHQNTIFCNIPDIPYLNGYVPNWAGSYTNYITYFIANYRTGLSSEILSDSIISNRIYKNIGHFVPINNATVSAATQEDGKIIFNNVEVWGGDCYPDYFGYARLLPYYTEGCDDADLTDYSIGLIFPVESSLNLSMRRGVTYERNATMPKWNSCENYQGGPIAWFSFNSGIFYSGVDDTYRRLEEFQLNSVLSATDSLTSYFVRSIYYKEESGYPNIEVVTEQKYPGEAYDSWRKILVNNFQYADNTLGAITSAQRIGMNVYVLQQGGFGRVRFNERTLATTDSSNLTVGTGQGYQGHDYIDQNIGCQHQWSVVNTGRQIYWVDANQGKMLSFGANGMQVMSDLRGQHEFFTNITKRYWEVKGLVLSDPNENNYDNPADVGGIAGAYDPTNGSILMTFTNRKSVVNNQIVTSDDADTIEYSDVDNKYVTHQQYHGQVYLNLKRFFLTTNPESTHDLYSVGTGERGDVFGVKKKSSLKLAINGNFLIDKVFDNAKVNVNPSGALLMEQVEMVAEGQPSQVVLFNNPADGRPMYRNSFMTYPTMQKGQTDRLRGKFLIVDYLFLNLNDEVVRLTSHETFYRKNYR
jgi:hypothetical protein